MLLAGLLVLSAWHLKQIWYSFVAGRWAPVVSYPLIPARLAFTFGAVGVPVWAYAACELWQSAHSA
jgi:hypothetical protein